MQSPAEQLKHEIHKFIEREEMTKTGFGLWALNDPNFVRDLETKSREPRWTTIQAVRAKMMSYAA